MPRVSVIIPSYNCARFIDRALQSVLDQTYSDYEIIVVDDGSSDETREVVMRYGSEIRYMYQRNRGLSAARNYALGAATGELIAYLDADDAWYPTKLEKQVAFLDANPRCGFVHSDVDVLDDRDQVVRRNFNRETGRLVPIGKCMLALLERCHVQILTVLIRHDIVRKVGYFDERLIGVQDYLQWILAAMEGAELGYIDESLALYRWTKGSLSSNEKRNTADLMRMFNILLEEKDIDGRCGPGAVHIVRNRLYSLGRDLAYLERIGGEGGHARRRLIGLIKAWPFRLDLYVDLIKACVLSGLPAQQRSPEA